MTIKEKLCTECGNKQEQSSDYCPSCGTENPWVIQDVYDMDDVDFPLITEYSVYDDHGELWNEFCREAFGTRLSESDIANIPRRFPRMEYCIFDVYFVVYKSEIDGPFMTEKKARESITDQ